MKPFGRCLRAASLAIGVIASAAPAIAAELLPATVAPTQWGGFYVSGQLGGAWSDADWRYLNRNWFDTLQAELLRTDFALEAGGVPAGGQAGFNYQSGAWVFGVEGSVAGADPEVRYENPVFPSDHYSSKITLLATATGRVGYAHDRWLGYVKGGWAGADVDLNILNRFSGVRAHSSTWANGWTVGAGGEYALTRNFSLAVEYDYAEVGIDHWQVSCPTCPSGLGGGVPIVDGDITVQSVTARLNYRFGH